MQSRFRGPTAAAPQLLRAAQAELAKPAHVPAVEFPAGPTLPQLEAMLSELRRQLETEEGSLTTKEEECENRLKRLAEISKEIGDAEKRLSDAKQQLAILTDDDLLTKTKQLELQSWHSCTPANGRHAQSGAVATRSGNRVAAHAVRLGSTGCNQQ